MPKWKYGWPQICKFCQAKIYSAYELHICPVCRKRQSDGKHIPHVSKKNPGDSTAKNFSKVMKWIKTRTGKRPTPDEVSRARMYANGERVIAKAKGDIKAERDANWSLILIRSNFPESMKNPGAEATGLACQCEQTMGKHRNRPCKNMAVYRVKTGSGGYNLCTDCAINWWTHKTRNPKSFKIHPQALASLKRYKEDLAAGHTGAAEYWRGQAGAYFTANPKAKRLGTFHDKDTVQFVLHHNQMLTDHIIDYQGPKSKYTGTGKYYYVIHFDELSEPWVISYKPSKGNPLPEALATVGNAVLAGLGLGVGFGAVNYAKGKLNKKKKGK